MKVGFTYDLKDDYLLEGYSEEEVAEFDSLVTIEAITSALSEMGHDVVRIGNFRSLMNKISDGERWDIVFNICEGLYGSGREALVPAILDAYNIPYTFSNPLVHALTLDKAITKRVLRDCGIAVTEFELITTYDQKVKLSSSYPYFVKPVAEGTGKGITPKSIVYSEKELNVRVSELLNLYNQPVLVEPYLTGREVTVGVIGNSDKAYCPGVLEVAFTDKADSDIHSYYNKANCEEAAVYTLSTDKFAHKCAKLAISAHNALGINDVCRVDIRADGNGEPFIMEVNSLPGFMPIRSDLVILWELGNRKYVDLIKSVFTAAVERIF